MATVNTTRYLDLVRRFAETVLERGRDDYGGSETPLFVDALDANAQRAARYDPATVIDDAILSNPANQQNFYRVLTELTRQTGETRYREAAEEVQAYVFENFADSNGLLYWGGHVAYDLEARELVHDPPRGMVHELKWHYPYYDLLWAVDPDATRRYVEAFWDAHIIDWSNLDFNRHGNYERTKGDVWDNEFEGGEIFFWGEGLSFENTGSDLYYAAGMLSEYTGEDAPLEWAKRLARRYVQTRHPEVGISGYQFSQSKNAGAGSPNVDDPRRERFKIRGDRAQYQFAPYLPQDHAVYEGTLFKPKPMTQRCQLHLGETLGERGAEFTQWALEEIRAWGEVAYRPDENVFEPMLTDGYSLEGFVCQRDGYFGPQGRVIEPLVANLDFFWLYAYAYRISSGGEVHWEMARNIARGNDLGDIGDSDGNGMSLHTGTDCADMNALFGLLDLYDATSRDDYLELAETVADNIVANYYVDGLFAEGDTAPIGDPRPLALLHLTAATEGEREQTPLNPAPAVGLFGDPQTGGI